MADGPFADRLLAAALDGSISAEEAHRLDDLAAGSPELRDEGASQFLVDRLLRVHDGKAVSRETIMAVLQQPPILRDRVVRAIERRAPGGAGRVHARGSRRRRVIPLAVAGALVGAAAAAFWGLSSPRQPASQATGDPVAPAPPGVESPVPRLGPASKTPAGVAGDAPRRPAPAATAPVLFFDFEDGHTPLELIVGVVVAHDRHGSRFAAIGGLNEFKQAGSLNEIAFRRYKPVLARYSETLTLTFDYWVGPEADILIVQVWQHDKAQLYRAVLHDVPHERWSRAVVRFCDLTPADEPDGPVLEPGDAIHSFAIYGGRINGKPLYIDNLKLTN